MIISVYVRQNKRQNYSNVVTQSYRDFMSQPVAIRFDGALTFLF